VTKVYWKKGLWKTNGYVAFIIEWKPMFVASIIEGTPMIMLLSYWIKPMCGCFLGKKEEEVIVMLLLSLDVSQCL